MEHIALVTGANKGIGKEIARQLAKQGVHVVMSARNAERGQAAADELQKDGLSVEFVQLDVTDDASVTAAAEKIKQKHGKLDILVNNAGIAIWPQDPMQFDAEAFKTTYDTNVFGIVRVTGAMHELLKASGHGRIVNMSSSLGSIGLTQKSDGRTLLPAYNSSKTAVNELTVAYSKLLAEDGIKVNSACPGYTATDMNDHRGVRSVEQGAATPVRLALIENDGPTGGFFDDNGPVEW
jgi:NAD(P)-dependent dehydrogenase (short-subunit alcohol dehydrogenase family)